MMVMRTAKGFLIPRCVFSESVFRDKTAFLKQIQGVVNGCFRDFDSVCDHPIVKSLSIKMPLTLEDRVKYSESFGCCAVFSPGLEMFGKNVVGSLDFHISSLFRISLNKNKMKCKRKHDLMLKTLESPEQYGITQSQFEFNPERAQIFGNFPCFFDSH